jgi:hypothetical protein
MRLVIGPEAAAAEPVAVVAGSWRRWPGRSPVLAGLPVLAGVGGPTRVGLGPRGPADIGPSACAGG